MNIGIDIDDTLVDSSKGAVKDIQKYDATGDIVKYVEEIMRGEIPNENIKKFLNDYSLPILRNAKVKKSAADVIRRLRNGGHKIIFITSRTDDACKGLQDKTLEYLKKNEIEYDKILFNSLDKAKVCMENEIDVMVDDSIKHCEAVENIGIKAFLFNSLVNIGKKTAVKRINTWKKLEKEIENIELKRNA